MSKYRAKINYWLFDKVDEIAFQLENWAMQRLLMAVDLGFPEAQWRLGIKLSVSCKHTAREYMEKAAAQGYDPAAKWLKDFPPEEKEDG